MIHECKELRNRHGVFKDRFDAGENLCSMLEGHIGRSEDVLLLAIPMGGVPVAVKIRELLGWPLELVIVRKLQIPGNPEAGFGAMTQEGDLFLNEPLMAHLKLSSEQVAEQTAKVRRELNDRNHRLRAGQPFPDLNGKTIIVVDDGLASGYTMKASVHMVLKKKALKTIVAVPTAPRHAVRELHKLVDDVFCVNIRDSLSFAVAEAYGNWYDLEEKEVLSLLARIESSI